MMSNGAIRCKAKTIFKMEVKNFINLAYSSNVLVCQGKEQLTIYNIPAFDENLADNLTDPNL